MTRYSVFSISGYSFRAGTTLHTTWYVTDNFDASRVVAEYDSEYEARQDAFRSNAEERRWRKSQEAACAAR